MTFNFLLFTTLRIIIWKFVYFIFNLIFCKLKFNFLCLCFLEFIIKIKFLTKFLCFFFNLMNNFMFSLSLNSMATYFNFNISKNFILLPIINSIYHMIM